jgi:hypothetical protein
MNETVESYMIAPDGDVTLVIRNPNEFFSDWPAAAKETTEAQTRTQTPAAKQATNVSSTTNLEDEIELEIMTPPHVAEVRFQVSSAHLILASPYFKSSLTGPWKEAQALEADQNVELDCPSFDTESMLIFLRIVHAQPWELPDTVEADLLAKLAVVGDYYGCQRLVKYHAAKWVVCVDRTSEIDERRELAVGLWNSWFFQHSQNFSAYSSLIIQQARSTITPLGLPIPSTVISNSQCPVVLDVRSH